MRHPCPGSCGCLASGEESGGGCLAGGLGAGAQWEAVKN